jgi:hypothetical protein
MVGCTLQKYENSPGCMNLCENDLDGIISAVKPESNNCPALTELGSPDVTVCTMLSMLVHVTVLPASVIIGFGEYDLSPRVAAFFTIETSFVLVLLAEEALEECS